MDLTSFLYLILITLVLKARHLGGSAWPFDIANAYLSRWYRMASPRPGLGLGAEDRPTA